MKVICAPNPFSPATRETTDFPDGITVRECLRRAGMGDGYACIVSVNGEWVLRAEWERPLPRGAEVSVLAVVHGGKNGGIWASVGMIVAGVIVTVATWGTGSGIGVALIAGGIAGLAASLLIQAPRVPNSLQSESGSPSYGLEGTNRIRIGEPIPVLYGRHRLFPDLIAAPYREFISDDEYLFMVLCLGVGEFEIEEVRIGEAPVTSLFGFVGEVVPPGSSVTLFPDIVVSSSIVRDRRLRAADDVFRAPNELLAFTAGNNRITAISGANIFNGVAPGDSVTVSQSGLNNGTFSITGTGGSLAVVNPAPANETPLAAGLYHNQGSRWLVRPGEATFTASTRTISDPRRKRFYGVSPGAVMNIGNTQFNNVTVTLATIATDGSSATVVESITNETNANPSFELATLGWEGPIPVNAANTVLQAIGIDVEFPGGLTDNGGDFTVQVEAQARPIDSAGVPLAGWTSLGIETITRNSLSPVRVTYKYSRPDISYPRWEVRMRRLSESTGSRFSPDDCFWAGLRGYLASVGTYPGVTVYALRVRASEQIPADVARQINIVATRKLPMWNGATWGVPTATRSPAWALADVLRSTGYGAALSDGRIDLAKLLQLDATWASRGDYFDGVFDQTITIWETLQRISRAGRAAPIVSGGVVTFVRDQEHAVRSVVYTPAHIKRGSLSIEYSFRQSDDADGVELSWIDPRTWRSAHVEAKVGGGSPLRPASVDLFGVTNQNQAEREAQYLARVDAYQRKVIRFATEMDGFIPRVGDLIGVSHDVPRWGQSGALLAINGTTYTTTEPLAWTPGTPHFVGFRKPDGTLSGPWAVTEVPGMPNAFYLAGAIDFAPQFDLSAGDRTAYLFGPGSTWVQDAVVTKLMPRSETEVEVTCQPYDPRIYLAGV